MIIVLVPELDTLTADASSLPRPLASILARSDRTRIDPATHQSLLLTGQPVAPAAVSRRIDRPDDCSGIWMRADPIDLKPDLNAVWLQPSSMPGLDGPVIEALTELFADAGLAFDLATSRRGYLQLKKLPDCEFQPPWQLAGQSMDHGLPSGPDAAVWTRLMSDCQVLFHQYRDDPEAWPSGLWFWGAGELPDRDSISPRVSHVAGSDPELIALADWLQLSHGPGNNQVADQSLVVWTGEPGSSAAENVDRLNSALKPLWRKLLTGRLDRLELASPGQVHALQPGQVWRFWQSPERGG